MNRKKYVIFAGVNGAGKTTLYQTNEEYLNMPRINIDEIVRKIGSWKNNSDVSKAGKIAIKQLKEYFEKSISFNQETTLCGKTIVKNIHRARELGYEVELNYVGVDSSDTAKKRVRQRVLAGGHGIPDEDIERRYTESISNLSKVIPLCHRVKIYDNSRSFRKIASFVDGICINKAEDIPEWCAHIVT